MNVALLGKKIGMTQVFDDANRLVPVTVIEAGPCPVTQVKSDETDGYNAVQIGFRAQKAQRLSKAARGHFEKAGVEAHAELSEFRTNGDHELNVGDILTVERFGSRQKIDVVGTSKGRGFQGVVKRYGFAGGPASTVPCFTAAVVPTACASGLVTLLKAKKCPVTWVTYNAPFKTSPS